MRKLKNRLFTVSTLVPNGARVADIGTDHGHLPIYLRQNEISSLCIACDIKEKPLESARQNIEKTGVDGIELRLGSGLEPVRPDEIDCVCIAGMGGEVISKILKNAAWIKDDRYTLILQPMTSADALRRFLCQEGFEIISETATAEADRIYTILKVKYSGAAFSPDEAFCRCGKLSPDKSFARKYIEKQLKIVGKCIDDLKASNRNDSAEALTDTYSSIKKLLGD